MRIGLILPHWAGSMAGNTPSPDEVLQFARSAQEIGLSSIWLTDHIYHEPYLDFLEHGYQLPEEHKGVRGGFWECWTLLAALAAETDEIEIGTLVTNTAFRNPTLLANMVETVDALSNGRVTLGLGAGDFRSEHLFLGYPWDRRVSRFEEALQIIVPMLRGERVTIEGEFYQAHDVELFPRGDRPKGPPILIGTMRSGPRMQRLAVQYADGWSCWLAFEDSHAESYAQRVQVMREACERYDRDPGTLSGNATIGVNAPGVEGLVPGASPITGSPAQVAEEILKFSALGVDHLALYLHPCNETGLEWLSTVLGEIGSRSRTEALSMS